MHTYIIHTYIHTVSIHICIHTLSILYIHTYINTLSKGTGAGGAAGASDASPHRKGSLFSPSLSKNKGEKNGAATKTKSEESTNNTTELPITGTMPLEGKSSPKVYRKGSMFSRKGSLFSHSQDFPNGSSGLSSNSGAVIGMYKCVLFGFV